MNRLGRVVTNPTAVIAGMRLVSLASKFLLTLFLAARLDLAVVGEYGLIVGASVLAPVAIRCGLFNLLSRNAVTQAPSTTLHDLRHYLVLSAALYAAISVAISIYNIPISHASTVLAFLVVVGEHLAADAFLLINGQKKQVAANLVYVCQTSLWIYPYLVAAWLFPSLATLNALLLFWMVGCALALLIAIAILQHWPWRSLLGTITPSWYREASKNAYPLYVADLAYTTSQYIDRYVITFTLGLQAAGIYVVLWQLGNAVSNLVSTSYGQLWRPLLIAQYKSPQTFEETFKKLLVPAAGMGALALCSAGLLMPSLLPAIAHNIPPYAYSALPFILGGAFLKIISDIYNLRLYALRRDDHVMMSACLACAAVVPIMYVMTQASGLIGAGLATVMTQCFIILYRFKTSQTEAPMK